jgi:hypothetical protein
VFLKNFARGVPGFLVRCKNKTKNYELFINFLHPIEHLYANLCEFFEANVKQMMRINGVYEYTETCEYEANKIHFRLDSFRSE